MKRLRIFSAGAAAGLCLGWLWGACEAAGRLVAYLGHGWLHGGSLPPISFLDLVGIPLMAGLAYGLVLAAFGIIAAPGAAFFLRRLPGRIALTGPYEAAAATALFAALFCSLYWWTRPILFYGRRFYDPRRLAAAAGLALLSIALALVLVKVFRGVGERIARKPAPPAFLLLFALALGGVFHLREAALRGGPRSAPEARSHPNVVLVVPDALRADHLGCYGYHPYDKPVTPFLDRLAEESVVFDQAVTQAPYTWTSFGSFLTGKYPRKHGLLKMDPTQRLDPQQNTTLAEILRDAGYTCGAFLMGTLSNNSGLLQGFDVYFEALVGHDPVWVRSKWSIFKSDLVLARLYNKIKQARDPALVNNLARRFIREMKDRPFFLLVHYYATHTPYDPPEPYKSMYDPDYTGPFQTFTKSHNLAVMEGKLPFTARDLRRVTALYDGGVTFVDDMIHALYDTLAEAGLLDRTLLAVYSDHGEELYDHGVFEHDWMFNTNLLVPLVIRFPGGRFGGRRFKDPVRLVDLLPTVTEVAGVPMPPEVAKVVDGRSILPFLEGRAPVPGPDYAFSENNRYLAVQDHRFKLVRYRFHDREEPDRLYDLVRDPGETENVKDRHPEVYRRLARVLEQYDRSMPVNTRHFESDPELYHRLFELGYIQGNVPVLEGELGRKKKAPPAAPGGGPRKKEP